MAGDKNDILGKSYYFQNNTDNNQPLPIESLLVGLLGGVGTAAGQIHATVTELIANSGTTLPIQTLLT